MWVINFWLKPECVTEKIKPLNVRLINYKTHLNFQTAHIIKAADTVS